jgi:hypothetical protein
MDNCTLSTSTRQGTNFLAPSGGAGMLPRVEQRGPGAPGPAAEPVVRQSSHSSRPGRGGGAIGCASVIPLPLAGQLPDSIPHPRVPLCPPDAGLRSTRGYNPRPHPGPNTCDGIVQAGAAMVCSKPGNGCEVSE